MAEGMSWADAGKLVWALKYLQSAVERIAEHVEETNPGLDPSGIQDDLLSADMRISELAERVASAYHNCGEPTA